jgi:enediyne biosynthesis protein E4
MAADEHVLPFDTNGSGLAVGDLDGDSKPDLVLGDIRSSTSLMWNEGDFRFTQQPLVDTEADVIESETRALAIADLTNDGRPDILASHTGGGVSLWRNLGGRRFEATSIDAISTPAYALLVDDLDLDGDLDLVTASYDALLEKEQGNAFLLTAGGGVVVYRREGSSYVASRLERKSQTLAMTLLDVTGDGVRDLVVGNDFGVPDMIWKIEPGVAPSEWKSITPFARTTRNTMGFAIGDPNRDGRFDMFATDMKPNLGDMSEVAKWSPLIDRPFNKLQRSDRQRAENVLQLQAEPGAFENKGYVRGIDATGWSWSAQFGDLDADGNEDLYIVNGMIDHELLPYLPGDEIVEPNVAFRGKGGARFGRDPKWGLDSTASGRSMALADLNNDGRLDVVINNLERPAEVFENRNCGGGTVSVDLAWAGVGNRFALGSIVTVETTEGAQHRLVTGSSGYLTWLPPGVHFGLGSAVPVAATVKWPDGATSRVPIDVPKSATGKSTPHFRITIDRPAEKL